VVLHNNIPNNKNDAEGRNIKGKYVNLYLFLFAYY